uniref:SET domain containing 3, actin histidine methyltransferase n=1 Tax=Latimeria chalumnae TaxID=7897 RepID=H3B052_LATCH
GQITTGYNLEDDRCECVALQDYKVGEQVNSFSGIVNNVKCYVVSYGFFFSLKKLCKKIRRHDITNGIPGNSNSQQIYKMYILGGGGLHSSSVFALHCSEPPISAQLLAFLRVFCMSEEELKDHLVGEHAIDKIFTLGNSEFPVSWDNEIKLWTFLETRAVLLLKTYKTTSENDKSLLANPELSFHARMAIKLRLAEKEILEKAIQSATAKIDHFRKQLQEDAPLPKYEESNIAFLENNVADSKLPVILRKIEEEADEQAATEDALVNGENSIPNGTKSEDEN